MIELPSVVPDPQLLLELTPEELGSKMLFLLRKRGGGTYHLGNLHSELWQPHSGGQLQYPRQHQKEIDLALSEAWAWLQAQGLIVPSENGGAGWFRLSRRARQMESEADFTSFGVGRLLPRELLHPRIADPVWRAFMRGEFDVAAFQAMKAVEVAVRSAASSG